MDTKLSEIIDNLKQVRNGIRNKQEYRCTSPSSSLFSSNSDMATQFGILDNLSPRNMVNTPSTDRMFSPTAVFSSTGWLKAKTPAFDFPNSRSDLLKTFRRSKRDVRRPQISHATSYKLDAAALLVDRMNKFVRKYFTVWAKHSEYCAIEDSVAQIDLHKTLKLTDSMPFRMPMSDKYRRRFKESMEDISKIEHEMDYVEQDTLKRPILQGVSITSPTLSGCVSPAQERSPLQLQDLDGSMILSCDDSVRSPIDESIFINIGSVRQQFQETRLRRKGDKFFDKMHSLAQTRLQYGFHRIHVCEKQSQIFELDPWATPTFRKQYNQSANMQQRYARTYIWKLRQLTETITRVTSRVNFERMWLYGYQTFQKEAYSAGVTAMQRLITRRKRIACRKVLGSVFESHNCTRLFDVLKKMVKKSLGHGILALWRNYENVGILKQKLRNLGRTIFRNHDQAKFRSFIKWQIVYQRLESWIENRSPTSQLKIPKVYNSNFSIQELSSEENTYIGPTAWETEQTFIFPDVARTLATRSIVRLTTQSVKYLSSVAMRQWRSALLPSEELVLRSCSLADELEVLRTSRVRAAFTRMRITNLAFQGKAERRKGELRKIWIRLSSKAYNDTKYVFSAWKICTQTGKSTGSLRYRVKPHNLRAERLKLRGFYGWRDIIVNRKNNSHTIPIAYKG